VTVRFGTYADLAVVAEQYAKEIIPSTGVDYPPLNPHKVALSICWAIGQGLLLVVEDDGEIVGSAALKMQQWDHADSQYLSDMWVYIREGHRNYRAFVDLCDAIKAVAQSRGVPLMVGVMRADDVDRKKLLYERQGFKPLGWFLTWGM
jgi:hypothetical protein